MTHVTCSLTAKNRDQLRNPTLGNRVCAIFYCDMQIYCDRHRVVEDQPRKNYQKNIAKLLLLSVFWTEDVTSLCVQLLRTLTTGSGTAPPRCPVWARERCRISPPRFLAECCKRQLNQGSFVLLCFRLFTFRICIEFVYLYFPVLFCLPVPVKWLAVKTVSEMTYYCVEWGVKLYSNQSRAAVRHAAVDR